MAEVPGLIELGSKYSDQGLQLLFFPCNQFCSEEPGTAQEIAAFYVQQHGLPASSLMERVDVNGPDTHAVYEFLRRVTVEGGATAHEPIEWNFSKFIVGRHGQVVARHGQAVKPAHLEKEILAWLG